MNGWAFTVLMGGPDPTDPKGGNTIARSAPALRSVVLVTYKTMPQLACRENKGWT